MASGDATILVLGQLYTLDVQNQTIQNMQFPSEVLSFARFREIVATAYADAEEDGDRARMAEALKAAQDFAHALGAANPLRLEEDRLATAVDPVPTDTRRRRTRTRDR